MPDGGRVVIEWDQVLINEIPAHTVSPAVFPRDAAILSAAVYDAVNSIDGSYTPYFVDIEPTTRRPVRPTTSSA